MIPGTMGARSIGTASISFGLVTIPIKLYTTTESSSGVSFNLLHDKCKGRVKQQYICPRDNNEVIERSAMVKGYEFAKDQYVTFNPEELKALEEKSTGTVDIVEFVPASTVDFIYIEKTYYIGPDKGGDRAYKLLSDAMTRMDRIAVGRWGTRGKEQLVLIRPYDGGLIVHQVYYADEVRSFADVDRPAALEFKPVEAQLADKLIEQLSTERFQPEQYHDDYRDRVQRAVDQKAAGHELTALPEAPQAQIIDLFEALKKSLKDLPAQNENATVEPAPAADDEKKSVKKAAPKKGAKQATG